MRCLFIFQGYHKYQEHEWELWVAIQLSVISERAINRMKRVGKPRRNTQAKTPLRTRTFVVAGQLPKY